MVRNKKTHKVLHRGGLGKTERGRGVTERRRGVNTWQAVGKMHVLINPFWPKSQSRKVFWSTEGIIIRNSKEKKKPVLFMGFCRVKSIYLRAK